MTFVVTLAALTGLVLMMVVMLNAANVASKARINRIDQRRAEIAAEAGVQRAIAVLTTASQTANNQTEDWHTLGTNGADNFLVGTVSFRLQIVDAGSLVNLNTAPTAQLQKLPLTQDLVDSLQDYISAGQTPRAQGAKDDYYHNLTNPYNTKTSALSTFDELLQVKGFTPAILYEPQSQQSTAALTTTDSQDLTLYDLCDVNSASRATDANGATLRNINNQNLQALTRAGISTQTATRLTNAPGRPFRTMAAVLQIVQTGGGNAARDAQVILRNFQVSGTAAQTGRINVNTASEAVLNTLPGITNDVTQQILQQQTNGIASVADLLSVPGVNLTTLRGFVDQVTVNSSLFIVRCVGKAGSTTVPIEAYVDMSGTTPKILKIEHSPYSDMPSRWNWDDANNDIDLGGQS